MDMDIYQEEAIQYTQPNVQGNLAYYSLGLAGEAGEVADKMKKVLRDETLDVRAIAYELGDTLWYLSQLSKALGFSLSEIANLNLDKLEDRKQRNVLRGSGDDR